MVHHNGPSQQLVSEPLKTLLHMDQRIGQADDALLLQRLLIPDTGISMHTGQRKKSRPPEFIFFQKLDHPFCRFLGIRHHVLDTAAQRGLDGDLIFLFHLDDIRHDPKEPRLPVPVCHHLSDAVSIAVVPLGNIFQRFQTGGFPVVGGLPQAELFLLLIQLSLVLLDLLLGLLDLSGKA